VNLLSDQVFDLAGYWTWLLISVRAATILTVLPGIGTSEIPAVFRGLLSIILAYAVTLSGVRAPEPSNLAEAGLMIGCETILGFVLASVPMLIIQSLSIAGQVVSGAIGLGFPSMLDPSTEHSVPVLSRIQTLVGTLLFMVVDGHHVVIRALGATGPDSQIGMFRPGMDIAQLYLERFIAMFELSIVCAGPVLVAAILAQFVLGLITRAVPQVNVFIISLPLTIGLGLYLTIFNLPGMVDKMVDEFSGLEEVVTRIGVTAP